MMKWATKKQGAKTTRESMSSTSPPLEVVLGGSRKWRASKVEEEIQKLFVSSSTTDSSAKVEEEFQKLFLSSSTTTTDSSTHYSMSGSASSSDECKHVVLVSPGESLLLNELSSANSRVEFKTSTVVRTQTHVARHQNEECGLCSEPLHGLRFVGACHPCGHRFHEDCFFGAWSSSLLQDEGAAKGEHSVNWISAQCMQCQSMVGDFERIAVGGDHGDYDTTSSSCGFELNSNEFDALFAKAKLNSLVRRCLSGPSSPSMVIHALRLIMDRIHQSNNEVKAEFLAVGGHVALMHAVARYSEEQDVWGWVNAVMAQLAVGYSDVLYVTTPNLALFIASSMIKHPNHERLQSNGCCTFSELCKSRFGKQAFQDIVEANGVAAVTAAIARFPLEAKSLHWNAIAFLAWAAEMDPMLVCEHICANKEALDVIVAILLESSISSSASSPPSVMGRLVCTILCTAARYPKFRGNIIKSGGAEVLQAVHMGSSDVPCQTMSKPILKMLGRPLVPKRRSSCAAI